MFLLSYSKRNTWVCTYGNRNQVSSDPFWEKWMIYRGNTIWIMARLQFLLPFVTGIITVSFFPPSDYVPPWHLEITPRLSWEMHSSECAAWKGSCSWDGAFHQRLSSSIQTLRYPIWADEGHIQVHCWRKSWHFGVSHRYATPKSSNYPWNTHLMSILRMISISHRCPFSLHFIFALAWPISWIFSHLVSTYGPE